MIESSISDDKQWARMERAVKKVNGGHAVRAWIAQVDEAAVRISP